MRFRDIMCLSLQAVRDFTPNVIEPSFGIGRILYSLLEHSYWAREQDAARGVSSRCDLPCRYSSCPIGPVTSPYCGTYQMFDCANQL